MDAARRGDTQPVMWTTRWLLLLPLLLCEGGCVAGKVESGPLRKMTPQLFPESPLRKVEHNQRQFSCPCPGQRGYRKFSYTEQAPERVTPPPP